MSKTVDEVIAELCAEISAAEADINTKKSTVNVLCGAVGRPPKFAINEPEKPKDLPTSFPPDAFYGEPLASSARKVLEASKQAGRGALSLDALYEALKSGGFAFDAKSDATARRSLAISLSKNTAAFVRLPNGDYGLKQWYKRVVRPRGNGSTSSRDGAYAPDDFEEDDDQSNTNSAAGLLPAPAADGFEDLEDREL